MSAEREMKADQDKEGVGIIEHQGRTLEVMPRSWPKDPAAGTFRELPPGLEWPKRRPTVTEQIGPGSWIERDAETGEVVSVSTMWRKEPHQEEKA